MKKNLYLNYSILLESNYSYLLQIRENIPDERFRQIYGDYYLAHELFEKYKITNSIDDLNLFYKNVQLFCWGCEVVSGNTFSGCCKARNKMTVKEFIDIVKRGGHYIFRLYGEEFSLSSLLNSSGTICLCSQQDKKGKISLSLNDNIQLFNTVDELLKFKMDNILLMDSISDITQWRQMIYC